MASANWWMSDPAFAALSRMTVAAFVSIPTAPSSPKDSTHPGSSARCLTAASAVIRFAHPTSGPLLSTTLRIVVTLVIGPRPSR